MSAHLFWEAYRVATFAVFLRAYSPTIDATPIERLAVAFWLEARAAERAKPVRS